MITSGTQERPIAAKYVGWFLVACTAPLFLGGAILWQSNMVNSGLLFMSLGLILAPDLFYRGWPLRIGILLLIGVGGVLAFLI
jgi:hypothetical protein